MEVAGRVDRGRDRRARPRRAREYDEAIAAGHRAAITEEERPGVFTLRVGNLMPGELATVRLTLAGPVPVDDGEATFRFPLVVAPRYIPGDAAARRERRPRRRRRHRRGPRRVAHHAARAPARVPEPRPARDRADDRRRGRADRRDPLEPARGRRRRARRGAPHRAAAGRAARPRLHPALARRRRGACAPRWRSRRDDEGEGGTFALTLVPPRAAPPTRRHRATSSS